MFAIATASLLTLVQQLSGTPYISGGDSARGTDCSGLVSFVTNAATGRPIYGDRFNTGNIEGALKARGFVYGTKPGAFNVGWNGGHTAATLPDGTPVSSGEGGGVRIGGGGAYQKQFYKHMYLEMAQEVAPAPDDALSPDVLPPPPDAPLPPDAVVVPVGMEAPLPPPPGELPPPPRRAAPAAGRRAAAASSRRVASASRRGAAAAAGRRIAGAAAKANCGFGSRRIRDC